MRLPHQHRPMHPDGTFVNDWKSWSILVVNTIPLLRQLLVGLNPLPFQPFPHISSYDKKATERMSQARRYFRLHLARSPPFDILLRCQIEHQHIYKRTLIVCQCNGMTSASFCCCCGQLKFADSCPSQSFLSHAIEDKRKKSDAFVIR